MLGEQIKNLRMSRGLNQVEMAKIFGVTKQSVSTDYLFSKKTFKF